MGPADDDDVSVIESAPKDDVPRESSASAAAALALEEGRKEPAPVTASVPATAQNPYRALLMSQNERAERAVTFILATSAVVMACMALEAHTESFTTSGLDHGFKLILAVLL